MTCNSLLPRTFGLVVLATAALFVAIWASPTAEAAGNCSGTSADVWIDYGYWGNDVIDSEGLWRVNGASSVRIRYRIDGNLYQTSTASGSPGTWYGWTFIDDFDECGNHTLEVEVCPRVWDGNGWSVCETHCDTDTANFTTFSCPNLDVDWICSLSGPGGVVEVEGTILDGNPPYKVETYAPNAWVTKYAATYSTGPHSYSNRCSYPGYKVGMRITDADGEEEEKYCFCEVLW
jgi:hypothetical protein